MLCIRLLLASLMLLGVTSHAVVADEKAKPADKKAEPESNPGWIVIEEDVWVRFIDEPSLHMQQAHESFLKKEFEAAAREMRKASGYLHVEARNASGEAKAALAASAQELDSLAKRTQAGTVKSVKSLETAFARAEHALAADFHTKAQAALNDKRLARAGHYLGSAVTHVENAAKWVGHELEGGAIATANGVRTVAGKLIEGSGFVVDEAGTGVKWVGAEVEKLGKVIEPHQRVEPVSKPVTNG